MTSTGERESCSSEERANGVTVSRFQKDVGAAISAYLRDARPSTVTRVLFCQVLCPPILGFKDSRIVSKILARACAALKIEMPARYLGSHVLRHSLATRMVRSGVALHEVGDVLRHKSRATTMIYAKLDIANLRSVAHLGPQGRHSNDPARRGLIDISISAGCLAPN